MSTPESSSSAASQAESPFVVILTTGGTIASSTSDSGVIQNDPERGVPELPAHLATQLPDGLRVETRAVMSADSSQIDDDRRLEICHAIADALADPAVTGVIVTHGTDSLAESALLADLYHADPRPVAFTGAQHAADHPSPDGPANLFDALQVVSSPSARDMGVLVVFGRAVLQARGVAKWHTTDELAFARNAPEVDDPAAASEASAGSEASARVVLPLPPRGTALPRVEGVWADSGATATALRALLDSGVDGYVLVAMGLGNVPARVAEVALEHPEVPCVVTSTVPRGAVFPTYGGLGGGADLVSHGAIPGGWLRGSQARVALLAVIADLRAGDPSAPLSPDTVGERYAALL